MSSKKSTQNKHDPISESEPEYSTDEGDEFSSDCEVEKTPQKKSKETKKTSKDSSSSKKVVHRSDKEKERKKKLSKRRPQSPCPLTSFDADIGLDISSIKFKPKKAKISSIVNIERKMIKVTEPGKNPYELFSLEKLETKSLNLIYHLIYSLRLSEDCITLNQIKKFIQLKNLIVGTNW